MAADGLGRAPFVRPLESGVHGFVHMAESLFEQLGDNADKSDLRTAPRCLMQADHDSSLLSTHLKGQRVSKARASTITSLKRVDPHAPKAVQFDRAVVHPVVETRTFDCQAVYKAGRPFAS